MGFLDNSRDIILDAVLTDLGRKRLAQGDGTFKITKFALGDDEINYALYDRNNASGSAYYDIDILQTPVFEAFTNNTSVMNNKLLSLTNDNLRYLPIMKLSQKDSPAATVGTLTTIAGGQKFSTLTGYENVFVIAINTATFTSIGGNGNTNIVINGDAADSNTNFIRIDQGIDNTEQAANQALDAELKETNYTLELDNRLGRISVNDAERQPLFIDDDNVAFYSFASVIDATSVFELAPENITSNNTATTNYAIVGSRGSALQFKVYASPELQASSGDYYFNTFGRTETINDLSYKVINSTITVSGEVTGYSIDIPVVFVKKV